MSAPQIFISYRRDDAAGYARAIGDALDRRFGPERVFIDVDDIGAGQAFGDVIAQAVGGSRVLLVLIGRRWLGEREGQPARLHDPGDLVRQEVATALASGMHVIPLLLDGAAMPAPAQLPAPLQALAGRHALAIDNTRFTADLDRLIEALQQLVEPLADPRVEPLTATARPASPAERTPDRPVWLRGTLLGAALLVALALWLGLRPTAAPPEARPAVNGSWQAEVTYDWPNAHFSERFEFSGDGHRLQGSASFLRVPRTIEDGTADASGLRFVTRSTELTGATARETAHHYQGVRVGDELRLTMQTQGGSSPHAPVTFIARRPAASAPLR